MNRYAALSATLLLCACAEAGEGGFIREDAGLPQASDLCEGKSGLRVLSESIVFLDGDVASSCGIPSTTFVLVNATDAPQTLFEVLQLEAREGVELSFPTDQFPATIPPGGTADVYGIASITAGEGEFLLAPIGFRTDSGCDFLNAGAFSPGENDPFLHTGRAGLSFGLTEAGTTAERTLKQWVFPGDSDSPPGVPDYFPYPESISIVKQMSFEEGPCFGVETTIRLLAPTTPGAVEGGLSYFFESAGFSGSAAIQLYAYVPE